MLAVAGFAFGAWVLDSRTRPLHPRASERVGSSPHEYEILAPSFAARTSSSRKTAWSGWRDTAVRDESNSV